MADHKNLVLNPNDPPAYVELLFDDPKPFESRSRYAKPGDQTFKFSVRMLAPYTGSKTALAAGEEAGFWLDNQFHVRALSAYRKGSRVKITKYKNPDMTYADMKFEPIVEATAATTKPNLYSEAKTLEPFEPVKAPETAPQAASSEPTIPARKTMREALVEAVAAVYGASEDLALIIGAEPAHAFENLMMDTEAIQKIAVTIYMRG
jgi:hypothetical protein